MQSLFRLFSLLVAFQTCMVFDHVLYLLAAGEIAFGIWGIYYEHKHPLEPSIERRREATAPMKERETENIHLH